MQLANKRVGTASTKRRDEVRGSGKKLLGKKALVWLVQEADALLRELAEAAAFGPKPRDFGFKVPKKVRQQAIKFALADKFQNDKVMVVESFNFDRPNTKQMVSVMKNLGVLE